MAVASLTSPGGTISQRTSCSSLSSSLSGPSFAMIPEPHVSGHLAPSWWSCSGTLWGLQEVEPLEAETEAGLEYKLSVHSFSGCDVTRHLTLLLICLSASKDLILLSHKPK